jgi:phage terminase large subunit-like protein
VDLASGYGLKPDDWQEWVIEGWLSRSKRTGRLTSSRCGLAVPRQNGKNAILEAVELFKLVMQGRKILHTAHEVKTARKAFLRLCSFFENSRVYPELAALVPENGIRRTNGQEAIMLNNGGSIEFIARSKGSGRGFTVDDLVCDEAQELSDDALAALYPTISAAPSQDPQIILTGTPPSQTMVGDVFTRFRNGGVEGKDGRLCWDEWSILPDADPDDPRSWEQANPALGIRLSVEVILDERAAMDQETFCREALRP